MSQTLAWILAAGLAMSLVSLSGSLTLVLPQNVFERVVPPLVGLAAGSLLGGALFHLLPEAVAELGNTSGVYGLAAAGIFGFLVLEQFLQWNHRRVNSARRPVGVLVLIADALHNFIDGLAIGTAFVLDLRLGVVTWLVIAAHEVPQELGDFGILVQSGWSRRSALLYNLVSSVTCPLGALLAYAASPALNVAYLLPLAAGNFLYLALADLIPEFADVPTAGKRVLQTSAVAAGMLLLWALASGL